MNDPYAVLGVTATASDEEISKAYKKLARRYHPDLNPGDKAAELKMKEINGAYETIKNIRSGRQTYSDTQRTYSGYTSGTGYGGSDDYNDPFAEYRRAYGSRFYGFDFSNFYNNADEHREKRAFGGFDLFRAFVRISLVLWALRLIFGFLFAPMF